MREILHKDTVQLTIDVEQLTINDELEAVAYEGTGFVFEVMISFFGETRLINDAAHAQIFSFLTKVALN